MIFAYIGTIVIDMQDLFSVQFLDLYDARSKKKKKNWKTPRVSFLRLRSSILAPQNAHQIKEMALFAACGIEYQADKGYGKRIPRMGTRMWWSWCAGA